MLNIPFSSDKERIKIIRAFGVSQLLKYENILKVNI